MSDARFPKRSLIAQISAVQQEIEMRELVYGNQVARRKMRRSEADYKIDDMRAVAATLHFLNANQDTIRAAVAAANKENSND